MDKLHAFYKALGQRVASGNIVPDGDGLKVIIGGLPVNQMFADHIGADGYAYDAGQAVAVAKQQMAEASA